MTPERCNVVVVGSSVGYFMRPLRGRLDERTYAEVLESALAERGIEARVTNSSRWTMLLPEVVRRVEELVLSHGPDVVVVHTGFVDAQPATMPLPVFRWLFARAPRGGRVSVAARARLSPLLDRWYRQAGPVLARRLPLPSRVSRSRFARDLRTLVRVVRHERAALVVLVGLTSPSAHVEAVLPGVSANVAAHDATLRRVSRDVRYLDTGGLGLQGSELTPDGIHLSPDAHRRVGEALADVVAEWWPEAQQGLRAEPGR